MESRNIKLSGCTKCLVTNVSSSVISQPGHVIKKNVEIFKNLHSTPHNCKSVGNCPENTLECQFSIKPSGLTRPHTGRVIRWKTRDVLTQYQHQGNMRGLIICIHPRHQSTTTTSPTGTTSNHKYMSVTSLWARVTQ